MRSKKLGRSEMAITRIGLGAWAIGGSWEWGWGAQDDQESIRTIHSALERGINWIDTAPVYGLGHSEEIIGQALSESQYEPYVFTKCGLIWNDQGHVSNCLKATSVRKEVEDSLRRLRVDVLDLCQIHWPKPDADIEEAWTALAELQAEEKVRYIGVSNFSVSQMQRAEAISPITSNQPPYSLLARDVEKEVLPHCRERQIGIINYSPMASGLLSGKMTRERLDNMAEDDWRRKSKMFKEPELTKNLKLAKLLGQIADRHACSVAEVAIAWTLRHEAISAAIVGLRKVEQIDGVINAADVDLSDDDIKQIMENF